MSYNSVKDRLIVNFIRDCSNGSSSTQWITIRSYAIGENVLALQRIVYETDWTGKDYYIFKKNIPTLKFPKIVHNSWSLKSKYLHFLYLLPESEWQAIEPLKDVATAANYL